MKIYWETITWNTCFMLHNAYWIRNHGNHGKSTRVQLHTINHKHNVRWTELKSGYTKKLIRHGKHYIEYLHLQVFSLPTPANSIITSDIITKQEQIFRQKQIRQLNWIVWLEPSWNEEHELLIQTHCSLQITNNREVNFVVFIRVQTSYLPKTKPLV